MGTVFGVGGWSSGLNEKSHLLYLLECFFSEQPVIVKKTATVMRELLKNKKERVFWTRLYVDLSGVCHNDFCGHRERIAEWVLDEELAHWDGIASLSRNGYIREKALAFLDKSSHSHEIFPYVLLRLNDWVLPVRKKAEEIFDKILPLMPVSELLQYYQIIQWLGATGRIRRKKEVRYKIHQRLLAKENRQHLFDAMSCASVDTRFYAWRLLLCHNEIQGDDSFIDKAIVDPDPRVRRRAADHLPNNDRFKGRMDILLSDRDPCVRYAALNKIPSRNYIAKFPASQEFLEICFSFFEKVIFDKSHLVRRHAQFIFFHQEGGGASVYRQRVLEADAPIGAWFGFLERCVEEDIPFIEKMCLENQNSKIRAAAFSALRRLRPEAEGSPQF